MSRVEKYIETKEKYFKTSLERDRTGLLHNHIKNTLNETLKYTKIGKTISVFVILACLSNCRFRSSRCCFCNYCLCNVDFIGCF